MQFGFFKVATATPKVKVADISYNCQEIIKEIKKANEHGVELLVFPELAITAYTCEDLFLQPLLLEKAIEGLQQIQAFTKNLKMLVFVGLPVQIGSNLYNCAAVLNDGKLLGLVPKMYLPNYNEFYEKRHFVGYKAENIFIEFLGKKVPFGNKLLFQEKTRKDIIVAAEICEDVWVPFSPSTNHANAGATIIVNLSASNEIVGKSAYRKLLLSAHSAKTMTIYLYANAGDGESSTDLIYSGHSLLLENGVLLNESKFFQNSLLIGEVDVQRITVERQRLAYLKGYDNHYWQFTFSAERDSCQLTRKISKLPFVLEEKTELSTRAEQILQMQAHALKKRMEHIGAKKAVIGISGGLDSALALLVIVQTFYLLKKPLTDIIAVTMPSFGTTSRTKQNALKLIQNLGLTSHVIDIKDAVQKHFQDIGHERSCLDTVYENVQARIRTLYLMNIANKTNGIVIGTGDLSEIALGFSTYNGDHMSMYCVNSSVPKTLVKDLIAYAARQFNQNIANILQSILETEISPELLPNQQDKIIQKTEDIVGSYQLNDFFLYYILRFAFTPKKIVFLAEHAFQSEYTRQEIVHWLKNFYRRFFINQFKRSCMPDGLKIGTISLSPRGDWRMPSDAVMQLWIDELENF